MVSAEERRAHRRTPVKASMQCRRLGRGGFDEALTSADLSPGGVLLRADRRLDVGDVLGLEISVGGFSVGMKGLVIATREIPSDYNSRYIHVAFTGLSPARLEALGRLLDAWEKDDDARAAEA